jgi:anti-sigma regulatory factor (Ser/Thr protein kinase)
MDADATTHAEPAAAASTEIELSLPAEMGAPRTARALVRDRWPATDDEVLDDVTLIVSELVSNAVKHGEPAILLRMRMDPLAIDISVLDHGAGVPPGQVTTPDTTATSGRGLSIVDRLASEWGVVPFESGTGKTVWARLIVPNPSDAADGPS